MKGGKDRDALIAVKSAAEFRNLLLGSQQDLGCKVAEGTDQLRLDGLKLADQERLARGGLIRLRISVPGRSALDDVANIDLLAGQLHRLDDPGEELSGPPHERLALLVFVRPPRLPPPNHP